MELIAGFEPATSSLPSNQDKKPVVIPGSFQGKKWEIERPHLNSWKEALQGLQTLQGLILLTFSETSKTWCLLFLIICPPKFPVLLARIIPSWLLFVDIFSGCIPWNISLTRFDMWQNLQFSSSFIILFSKEVVIAIHFSAVNWHDVNALPCIGKEKIDREILLCYWTLSIFFYR